MNKTNYFKPIELEYTTKECIISRILTNEGLTVADFSSCDGLRDMTLNDVDIDSAWFYISDNFELVVEFNDESFLIDLSSINDILRTYEYDLDI